MAIKISNTTIINDNRAIENYGITHNVLGSVSGTATINLQLGNYVSVTVTDATTFIFSNPLASPIASGFVLELTNGGSTTITWPTSVRWPGGVSPELTTDGVDVLVFITDDGGTNWRGTVSMSDSRAEV
jgi:hypothetical protein